MSVEKPESIYVPVYSDINGQKVIVGLQARDMDLGKVHFLDGMFMPADADIAAVMTYGLHYGGGSAFEGIRARISPEGTYLLNPAANAVRLILSSLFIMPHQDPLLRDLMTQGATLVDYPTPTEFYGLAQEALEMGKDFSLSYRLADGSTKQKPFVLRANKNFKLNAIYSIQEIVALTQALMFLDGTAFANYDVYCRPIVFVNDLLKIPTYGKMLSFAMSTRPWGAYLDADAYATGVNALDAPYPRIGVDMPFWAKMCGCYANSALNVNPVALVNEFLSDKFGFKFREVLVRNQDGGFVEGSAENIAAFFEVNGEIIAKTPQAGPETGILAGTTRSRFLEWCGKNNITVEFSPITDEDLKRSVAVVLMGTGVGAVHLRSVTTIRNLREVMDAYNGLKVEGVPINHLAIPALLDGGYETTLINDGKKHPIVGRLQTDINRTGSKLPLWQINLNALARALELEPADLESIVPSEERSRFRSEELLTKEDRRELKEKMQIAERICKAAMEVSHRVVIPLRNERAMTIHSASMQAIQTARRKIA